MCTSLYVRSCQRVELCFYKMNSLFSFQICYSRCFCLLLHFKQAIQEEGIINLSSRSQWSMTDYTRSSSQNQYSDPECKISTCVKIGPFYSCLWLCNMNTPVVYGDKKKKVFFYEKATYNTIKCYVYIYFLI